MSKIFGKKDIPKNHVDRANKPISTFALELKNIQEKLGACYKTNRHLIDTSDP